MRTVTLKGLWSHKRRLLGTFLAVVLGVSFLFGTLLLGDTMRASFQSLFASANAGSDAVVRAESQIVSPGDATPGFVEESLTSDITSVPGVAAVAPVHRANRIQWSDFPHAVVGSPKNGREAGVRIEVGQAHERSAQ